MSALLRLCALCCLAECAFAESTVPSLVSHAIVYPLSMQDICLRCGGSPKGREPFSSAPC